MAQPLTAGPAAKRAELIQPKPVAGIESHCDQEDCEEHANDLANALGFSDADPNRKASADPRTTDVGWELPRDPTFVETVYKGMRKRMPISCAQARRYLTQKAHELHLSLHNEKVVAPTAGEIQEYLGLGPTRAVKVQPWIDEILSEEHQGRLADDAKTRRATAGLRA